VGNPMGAPRDPAMGAFLSTIPGNVSVTGTDAANAETDVGNAFGGVVVAFLLLLTLLMMSGVFRALGQGLGSILDSLFSPGTLLQPPTKAPTRVKTVEREDFFRVLPEIGHTVTVVSDEHFALLPTDDTTQLHAPKCFVCGRPLNEGDHSHS